MHDEAADTGPDVETGNLPHASDDIDDSLGEEAERNESEDTVGSMAAAIAVGLEGGGGESLLAPARNFGDEGREKTIADGLALFQKNFKQVSFRQPKTI